MEKEQIVQKIVEATEAYYNSGNPIMSDAEFDILIDRLKGIDPDHPVLHRVGARPMGQTFEHRIPAGSQEKLKDKNAYER